MQSAFAAGKNRGVEWFESLQPALPRSPAVVLNHLQFPWSIEFA
jgi:hypothetical protein